MTDIGSPAPMTNSRRTAPRSSGWTGWLFFAAAMMLLNGVVWVIEGRMALVNDDYFHVTASGVALNVNYTAWGSCTSSWRCLLRERHRRPRPETGLPVASASCSPESMHW